MGCAAGIEASALDARGVHPTGRKVTVRARAVVVSGGGINTPGLLLRSKLPDPHGRLGKRTFLHPVVLSVATLPDPVDGFQGAPQSVYSDHFLWRDGVTGKAGFKLEAAPLYPMLFMSLAGRLGKAGLERAAPDYRYSHAIIALLRDGYHEQSPGGTVLLRDDGSAVLDYPLDDYLWEGFLTAWERVAEIQFAAGARQVHPLHMDAQAYGSWAEAKAAIRDLPRRPVSAGVFSAHLMGGCAMGQDPQHAVVDSTGQHHQVPGLSVIDGSIFPTSLGVNPQLSIYAVAGLLATRLAASLGGTSAAA